MNKKGYILVAPLNWGLGHACRCIPIIQALIVAGYNPMIASDGAAFDFLVHEFPHVPSLKLPALSIKYPEKGKNFKWAMMKSLPGILTSISREHKVIKKLVDTGTIAGIISDNRGGCYDSRVPSIFMTHQLEVKSGITTSITTQGHRNIMKNFDEIWVPDVETTPNLSGTLGHPKKVAKNVTYIGPLSRFQKSLDIKSKYDLMVLLSGPEPQRGILEKQLLSELKSYHGTIIFVRGVVEKTQVFEKVKNVTTYNFLAGEGLQKAFDRSAMVLCRSGYSSIMDIARLEKKAFFIPTPGQYEQEYLASLMKENGLAPCASQDAFKTSMLEEITTYSGLKNLNFGETGLSDLFHSAFSSVNENSDPIPGSLST